MEVFYCLNIAGFVLVSLISPIYFSRRFDLGPWNLLTIPLLVSLPLTSLTSFSGPYFFLSGSLYNPYFQYALLVNNVFSGLQATALIFLVHQIQKSAAISRRLERILVRNGEAKPPRMIIAAWIFLGLYLLSFLLLTQSFGLLNWIANPRVGYQLHRAGAGQWFAFAITFLSTSMVLATIYVRSTHSILLLAPFYLFFVSLLGSKGFSVAFALFLVIILALRRYSYLKPVALIIGVGAGSFVISNFISSLGGFGLQEISQYSDYFVNAALYYKSYLNGGIPLFHGEIFLSNLWGLVPRALYPDKPYVYGLIKVVDFFYPGSAEKTSTPAFATVDAFADFGWPQVFASALLAPQNLISAILYVIVLPRLGALNTRLHVPHPCILTYCFLIMNAPAFLLYFEFPLNLILLFFIIGLIYVTNGLRVVRATGGGPLPSTVELPQNSRELPPPSKQRPGTGIISS